MIPFWGLSEVVGNSRERILGKECEFCEIQPQRLNEPIKYTHQTIRELGIRPVMSPQEMILLLQQPLPPSQLEKMPGTRRYQRWIRLLRSGRKGARRKILREMTEVETAGGRLLAREKDLRLTVERNYRAEVSEVLQLSPQKADRFVKASYRTKVS